MEPNTSKAAAPARCRFFRWLAILAATLYALNRRHNYSTVFNAWVIVAMVPLYLGHEFYRWATFADDTIDGDLSSDAKQTDNG
jgi:hypothetical protein